MSVAVSVRPPGAAPGSSLLENRFFGGGGHYVHFGESEHWLRPYGHLRDQALREGIVLFTEDMIDLDKCVAMIFVDIPSSATELEIIRRKHPHLKLVLQTIESPLGRLWSLDPVNHRQFDAVVSYDDRHRGRPGYTIYKIPAGGLDGWNGPLRDEPWEKRRLGCLVAAMKGVPPPWPSRSGVGMYQKGWRFNPNTWWDYTTHGGSLLRARCEVAEAMSRQAGSTFDIFGPGWSASSSESIRGSARGPATASKLDFLGAYRFNVAFENCRNDCGYITEKLFDALLAGTVPVYLGNESIQTFAPPNSFVDARMFPNFTELAVYLQGMEKAQWLEMRQAGMDWLRGAALPQFGAQQSTIATLEALNFALSRKLS